MDEKKLNELFGETVKAARNASKLTQSELAAKIGASLDLIIRMEKGKNVGIHSILHALNVLGYKIEISIKDLEDVTIVLGDFDSFYQSQIRQAMELDLKQNPNQEHGYVSQKNNGKFKVVNWKNAKL